MKIAVLGDGAWGTALAMVLNGNGHSVRIWSAFPEHAREFSRRRENTRFLPGVGLPETIEWTADRAEAVNDAEVVVLAVPSRYFREAVGPFRGIMPSNADLVSVAKGFDPVTGARMTELAVRVLGLNRVAALSGPSHAEEVARGIPTAVVLACADEPLARRLQTVFSSLCFRVYTSRDVVGVELGGALKNIIAIAVGVSDGLGFGDNTRAALVTRGLAEITRLGCALGAQRETFSGLSGAGDLIATCTSRLSRNRAFGEQVGRGEKASDVLHSMKQAAEGAWNCAMARELARRAGVEAPITEEVYSLIHEGKNPLDAVKSLLTRSVKLES